METAILSGCDPEESDEPEELEDELEKVPEVLAAEEDELNDELLPEESLKCSFLEDFSAVASSAELTWKGGTSGVTGGSMVGDSIGAS
jgi:hypothetical protein